MFHPVSVFVGLRYLRGRSGDRFSRFVSYLSTAGIAIGVLSLVTVISVMNGFEAGLKSKMLGVLPQAIVSQNDERTPSHPVPDFLANLPDVKTVSPIIRSDAVLQSSVELTAGLLIGVEPKISDPINRYLRSGVMTDLESGKYRVMLGQRLANNLGVRYGDTIRIMVTDASQYTPLGRIPSQRNFTVAGTFSTGSDVDGQLVAINIEDAARLLRYPKETISGWRLSFDDPFLATNLGPADLPSEWQWSDWRDQRGEFFQSVKMERNMMGLMLGLIILVAAFNIISALIMVVMEKQAEVAILKTQGMTQFQILSIFMVQGASSGVIGALVGGGLGVWLASNINQVLSYVGIPLYQIGGTLPVVIEVPQVMMIIILAILLSLLATLFPSYRASSVKPAEALRYE